MQSLADIETLEKKDKNYTYLDLIKTPKMRRLTLLTGIVWWVSPRQIRYGQSRLTMTVFSYII